MEFRCRLVSATGEIVEGVYAADSEARLRHELEEKGLHVLALRQSGALGGWSSSLPRRRKVRPREFIEFNQELATLLKAGMPLVQSLDLLRSGVTDPLFRSVLDRVYDRVKSGTALSDAFEEHGDLFPRVKGKPLPAWAAEFDCSSWAQFFLKWILGHPAVTCVIPGTRLVAHMKDNLAAGRGRLPDAAQRDRMLEHLRAL